MTRLQELADDHRGELGRSDTFRLHPSAQLAHLPRPTAHRDRPVAPPRQLDSEPRPVGGQRPRHLRTPSMTHPRLPAPHHAVSKPEASDRPTRLCRAAAADHPERRARRDAARHNPVLSIFRVRPSSAELTNADMDLPRWFACLLIGQRTLRRRIKLGTFAALDQRIRPR